MIGMVVFHPSKLAQTFTDQQIALASATAQLVGLAVERERLLREREEAHASALALAETNRQMDTFLGLASHELRTPLAILKLSLQLLRRGFEQMSGERQAAGDMEGIPTLKPFLETAERQMRRLERLVKDLLSAARAREGTMDLRIEPVDLGILVQEVVEEQRLLTPERSILLDPPADPPLVARADGDHIRQAMMNYLTNALKYSPEPMPVQVGLEQKAGQAHFWVRDEGPGIPLADHEHLWERFHQVPGIREQSRLTGGLGLGLYLTKMLIEQHHGQVGIISLPGQGSTFWFSLPLVQGERAE
jgi:signal transduction histidine kinase